MAEWVMLLVVMAVAWALAYWRASLLIWTVAVAAALFALGATAEVGRTTMAVLWAGFMVAAALFNIAPLRRTLIAGPVLGWFRGALPQVSQTEQEALDAGTVWWDGELFSGRPDWGKLLSLPRPELSAEEKMFLAGPVETLCGMLDDWKITHELYYLPPEVWKFVKDKGFLGMIIPKQYGGLGYSALAHSEVVAKLSTRSGTGAVSVMVPNSLGPAELLLNYGTDEQKNHYLPRLAKGEEIPCFALTGPEAGSDASSIPDAGIVCKGAFQGRQDVLGIRLNWEKRYITLGPIATLLGLAFKLYDPDHLIGDREDIGITLALIPTTTPGIEIGRRHFPLNSAFFNGPTSGKDVFIPMDWVIGGVKYAGQGWRMLMNCLAAGRSISLPANSAGMAKLAALTTGAYGRVRIQFRTPIGKFEGVEEALARIGGHTYMMDAARVMTAGAVDLGEKPAVVSAIVKYHLTERGRIVINDAMDVHGGKAICMGPRNYLGRAYQQTPIAITVEGANILTRCMIIFGQGAIRGHPYVLREINATRQADPRRAVKDFDDAFFGHIGFVVSNAARALFLGLTGARLASVPGDADTRRYYQHLTRLSAAFAFATDIAMLLLGGQLKRREKLSARLGDVLSQLYLCSATLKRYEDGGRLQGELPLLDWSIRDALFRIQTALVGIIANFPSRAAALLLRVAIFPIGQHFSPPSDELGHRVAGLLLEPSAVRDRLTQGVFVPSNPDEPVAQLEQAMRAAIIAEAVYSRIYTAARQDRISGKTPDELAMRAREAGVITREELDAVARAKALRRAVVMVDDFPPDFGKEGTGAKPADTVEAGRRTA
ncbi:MAG: acyl-CoA dehydrogenase [Betaproteobacteria bacterium]|nr:acyl-CoA dehydrogenase [Betaproteobacteria bacterium]